MASAARKILERAQQPTSTSTSFDMQEVLSRFVFDLSAKRLFGVDPGLLSLEMPPMDVGVAMDTVMEVGFFRHVIPASCWKAMRRLNIGPEKKLNAAHKVIREFFMEMIERKKINGAPVCNDGEQERVDILFSYINDPDYADNDLLGANLVSLMLARRLYPSAPIERKIVAADDIMPSGHKVHASDTILISLHSMGRMEDIWGKDCNDYNPQRWLSKDGSKLRYIPSHKFLSINSGPRMCPGNDIAVLQMKAFVALVVWNFDLEVVEGQSIQPKLSCTLQMKNGLMMVLKRAT
uniref:Cytochrome P450 86A2 n=1 Tax=Aegilops tauschii TaxID=37682 RepID=M8BSF0_AEGTA